MKVQAGLQNLFFYHTLYEYKFYFNAEEMDALCRITNYVDTGIKAYALIKMFDAEI